MLSVNANLSNQSGNSKNQSEEDNSTRQGGSAVRGHPFLTSTKNQFFDPHKKSIFWPDDPQKWRISPRPHLIIWIGKWKYEQWTFIQCEQKNENWTFSLSRVEF